MKTLRGIATQPPYPSLTAYCPDLGEWPQRWQYEERDRIPGQALVDAFTPFLLHLLGSGLARKTLRRHRDNLWLLGGQIIRKIQQEPELRDRGVVATLLDAVDDEYGPLLDRHATEEDQRSFDATCRKLRAFFAAQPPQVR